MNKVCSSVDEAVADIFDGATVAVGGFFIAGVPLGLIRALIRKRAKDLTLACGVGPLLGFPDLLEELVENRQIRKVIECYPFYRSASKGGQCAFERAVRAGQIEVEVYPMGTLAEKYRAGGAGIPAFYTPTGVGTIVAEGKEVRVFDGQEVVLERALKPDFAFIHAYAGDQEGNLIYRKTATNFNPEMAAAGRVTIAEVENLLAAGELAPDQVKTPGIYVQRVVQVERPKIPVTPP